MGRRLHPAVAVLALPVAFATLAAQQNAPTAPPSTRVDYALTNVRIVTAPGKVIERGTVVTRDGRIQLITSSKHYAFNLAWLKQLPEGAKK